MPDPLSLIVAGRTWLAKGEDQLSGEQFLKASDVMARYGVSKNTLYGGPLRKLAVAVGNRNALRWALSRLREWERAQEFPSPEGDHRSA